MPKKNTTKLSELLAEIDRDQLCDIILRLTESGADLESLVRRLISPKAKINNSLAYYRKLAKGVPAKIKNSSDRKLLLESLKPLLIFANDLISSKDYTESNKVLFVILEIILMRAATSNFKSMTTELQKYTQKWSENVDKIDNSEDRFNALNSVLELEKSKYLKLEEVIVGYKIDVDGFVPVYSNSDSLHVDFVEMLTQIAKSSNDTQVLESLRKYITSHSKHKEFELVNVIISQKIDTEKNFLKIINNRFRDRSFALIAKDYYMQKGDFETMMGMFFDHIKSYKEYFWHKNSDEYTSALEFLDLYKQYPDYSSLDNYCQVLILLITTGDSNVAQDISDKAKWRLWYAELKSISLDWSDHYNQIISILSKKCLSKMLFAVAYLERDVDSISKYVNYSDDIDTVMDCCKLITSKYPDIALKNLIKIINSIISYDDFDDFKKNYPLTTIVEMLHLIKANINVEMHKKIDNFEKKITSQ